MALMQSPAKELLPKNGIDEREERPLINAIDKVGMVVDVASQVQGKLEKAINMAIVSTLEIAMQPYEKKHGDEIWNYLMLDYIERDMYDITDDSVVDAFKEIRKRHGIKE